MSRVILKHEFYEPLVFAPDVIRILNNAIAPEKPISPREAATALDALFEKDYVQHLWFFWELIHDLSRQIPYDRPEQDRLVAVIKALQDLPPKKVNMGEQWGVIVEQWKDLYHFGHTYREALNGQGYPGAPGDSEEYERYVNLQAYAARVSNVCSQNFDVWMIWTLVDALEGTMTPVPGAPDKVNANPAAVENISYKARSAAVWMIHAAHMYYGRDEEVHATSAGPLWKLDEKEAIKLGRKCKGTSGLCLQRWNLWKERFGVIRDTEELDEKVRKEAGDAYTAMDKVEKEHTSSSVSSNKCKQL